MNTLKIIGAALAGIVVGYVISSTGSFGGVYNQVNKYFLDGLSVGQTAQLTVSNAGVLTTSGAITTTGDATVSGGTVTVTTTNAATSTVALGCIQMPATSTATQYKIVISSVATTTTTYGNGTAGYAVVAMPGTCPNL